MQLPTQRPFHDVIPLKQGCQSAEFIVRQFTCFNRGIYAGLMTQITSRLRTDTVEVGQRNPRGAIIGDVDTGRRGICGYSLILPRMVLTTGSRLALPLLMTRIGADHNDHSPPLHDLALIANALDAGSNFHGTVPGWKLFNLP